MSKNKVKSIKVLDGTTLESTAAATQAATSRVIVDSYFSDKLNLSCIYTTGAGETNNTCSITVWGYIGDKSEDNNYPYDGTRNGSIAADEDNWIQLGTYAVSTGTATFTATTFNIVGASAATAYDAQFLIDILFSKIRIAASESGVATNKGTLTVVASVQ